MFKITKPMEKQTKQIYRLAKLSSRLEQMKRLLNARKVKSNERESA